MGDEKIQIKISLTKEEYEILKELSELEGKPMSAYFMDFVRKGRMFNNLSMVLKAVRRVAKLKNSFDLSKKENLVRD